VTDGHRIEIERVQIAAIGRSSWKRNSTVPALSVLD
jgi:hypothetical protein